MEEQLSPLAVAHLLQHTLRSLCIHENSQWVYAVFWRILPRNFPPPKWDFHGGMYDRARGNRRNWILVWEDGFCNFSASCTDHAVTDSAAAVSGGLQPELFFKMSHEIYSYGEGLIGKVAADQNHKWVFKDPQDNEINFLSTWNNPNDSQPRTWEAQFQSGIKTIALVAVREGVVQLGAVNKVTEDLTLVLLLRKKFSYLESIPGVLLPHPSSSAFPAIDAATFPADSHSHELHLGSFSGRSSFALPDDHSLGSGQPATPSVMRITPSMSSLEALLSKLPAVGPAPSSSSSSHYYDAHPMLAGDQKAAPPPPSVGLVGMEKMVKEDMEEEYEHGGDCSSSFSPNYYINLAKAANQGFY